MIALPPACHPAYDPSPLLEVASGRRPADLLIRGGRLVNVYSGEIYPAHVAIAGERIAYVGARELGVGPRTRVLDAAGRFLVPGYVEPHAHPSVLCNPAAFCEAHLLSGVTAAFCDNLAFAHRIGLKGFDRLTADLAALPFRFWWLARIGLPASTDEEAELFSPEAVARWLERPDVAGLAEYTRWPELAEGAPRLLACHTEARRRGKRIDGHTAGCSAERLGGVVLAGIDACHEAITAEQARDRLRLGLWTALRHSSLRPDLDDLLPIVLEGLDTRRVMFTTDTPAPAFIARHGLIDGMLRRAVRAGVPPVTALQMATVNPATFFGRDRDIGGIAPGRFADVLLLEDLESFRPQTVVARGRLAAEAGRLAIDPPILRWADYGEPAAFSPAVPWDDPRLYVAVPPRGAQGPVPVIDFISSAITRRLDLEMEAGEAPDAARADGLLHAVLIERAGRWLTRGLVRRLAPGVRGFAMLDQTGASLLAFGADPEAMARAAQFVVRERGGIAVLGPGSAELWVRLPFGGTMVEGGFAAAVDVDRLVGERFAAAGYPYHDWLHTVYFLTCDFLPGLRLTPRGLLDVRERRVVAPPSPVPTAF